jgi:hypothetical protein
MVQLVVRLRIITNVRAYIAMRLDNLDSYTFQATERNKRVVVSFSRPYPPSHRSIEGLAYRGAEKGPPECDVRCGTCDRQRDLRY